MRVTVIYDDKFIKVDNKGMFYTDNWPFKEKDIHAIQWYDDHGELEYRTREPNKEITDQSEIQKYIDFFQVEYAKWEEEQNKIQEEERKRIITWEEAMKELELQIDTMQINHQQEIEKVFDDHTQRLESVKKERDTIYDTVQKNYEETLQKAYEENDQLIEKIYQQKEEEISLIYQKVDENHLNLFYAQDEIANNNISVNRGVPYENSTTYDDITIFDSNVDPSLFDDSVDPSTFDEDPLEAAPEETIEDFSNFDLSLLEDEFNLEMLFEEDPDPIVNEIEELIAQEETKPAEIPDK